MADLFLQIPFEKVGWAAVQTLWLSTLYLSGFYLAWKIIGPLPPRMNYNLGLGALFSLPFIPAFLFMEHQGVLPPIGLADWAPAQAEAARTPLIEGLPKITGVDLAVIAPSIYYWIGILWTTAAGLLLAHHLYSMISLHLFCRSKPKLRDAKVLSELGSWLPSLASGMILKSKSAALRKGPPLPEQQLSLY